MTNNNRNYLFTQNFYFLVALILVLSTNNSFSQDNHFTGYAIATVNQDSIIETKAAGYANKLDKTPYSIKTIQPVGSVSKTLIGISLLIAKEKGLVNLDEDINTYLDFNIKNPYLKEENIITLRHLATHTSGIIDNEKIYEESYCFNTTPTISLKDYLKTHLNSNNTKHLKKSFYKSRAGKRYSYSNIGSALAAYIIEKVSGQSYADFTKENILNPLGMSNSGWFYSDIDNFQHTVLYDEKDKELNPYTLITYPDGGFRTTITDLSLYLIEIIKGYNGNSSLLSKESWNELFKRNFTTAVKVDNINEREPNTGLFMVYFKSGKIGHTGSDPGVSCLMMFDPKSNNGKIFMSNEDITKENLSEFKKIWGIQ